ncbi:glycosyltransferase [Candidatus Latescibacterota bacterium]
MAKRKRRSKKGHQTARGRSERKSPRLSLCLIARDEAAFLEQCLASVGDLVDEIVVVDTGSVDETMDVARRHGARLLETPWCDDFSAPRNLALSRARGQWILVLDCDEVLAPRDHQGVRQCMASGEADAFRLTTRNYTDEAGRSGWTACDGDYPQEGPYRGWFPTTKVRLWRRTEGVCFEGVVHELVEPALAAKGLRVGDCPVPVHHYGYAAKDRAEDRYLAAGERKAEQNPDDLRARYELAVVYRNAGRLAEALTAIERVVGGLAAAPSAEHLYVDEELVPLVHGDVLDRLGRLDEALAVYAAAVDRFPHSFQAWNNMGSVLSRKGDLVGARRCYERGLSLAPDNPILADNVSRLDRREGTPSVAATVRPETSHSLSVCIIARDAATDLERCLDSVREVADEIVVVDTGSTDDTVEVARRSGARIGHFAWCDDFSAARNISLDMATSEWILWMDADDYLLPVDGDKVANAKGLPPDQALYFDLVNTGGADTTRFRQVKMLPNHPDIRFERPVHETVVPSLQRLGIPITATDAEVMHTGYASEEEVARKSAYYLSLLERWVSEHPDDHDACFRIGHTHYSEGRRGDARECFARILEVGRQAVAPESIFAHAAAFHGRCLLEEGDPAGAVADLETALEVRPDDVLANLSLGDALTKMGEYERAIGHLRTSLSARPDPHFPLDVLVLAYSAHFFLGQCLQSLGRFAEAAEEFVAAQRVQPQRPEASAALRQIRLSASAAKDPPEQALGGPSTDRGLYEHPEDLAPSPEQLGTGQRQRLSLCMIVRDEEERLGKCLESVRDLVDEIVVVDTGSTDRTVALAESFGARLGHFEWCDDFSAARNVSIGMATGDWIMWLDADDVLPAECHEQIRRLIGQGRDKSYFFVLDDQGYESVSCLQMRLFPNLPGVAFEMPIHEQATLSLARLGVQMIPTDVRVVHTGYTTPEVVRAKKDRYLGIMERWLEANPGDYIVRSHVALTYHTTGRLEEAIEQYRLIVEESRCLADHNYVVYTTALLFRGRSHLKLGQHDEAREWMHRAEEMDADYVLTRFSLAELYGEMGEPERAIEYARSVLGSDQQLTFFPIDQKELAYSALCVSGRAHLQLGQLDEAEDSYRRAFEVPVARRSDALGSLSEVYKARGDRRLATEALDRARAMDPDNTKHIFNTGMLHLEAGELDAASDRFGEVLERSPNYGPALLNLGFIAKTRGDGAEAERLYLALLSEEPHHLDGRANLAHLYLSQERYDDAALAFDQVRRQNAELLDINLGLLLAKLGGGTWEPGLAREALTQVGEVEWAEVDLADPVRAAALCIQAGAALTRHKQVKCAEFAFRASVILADSAGATVAAARAHRCLGEVLTSQGQLQQAIPHFEAVLLADANDAEAFQRLGDCYQQLGVLDAAQLCYEKAGELSAGL